MSQQSKWKYLSGENHINELSPVGIGRSLTGVLQPKHEGQLVRGIAQGLVEIGGTLCETRHALGMGVECEVVGEALGDWEAISEENGCQLCSDFASGESLYFSVAHTDGAAKSNLPSAARFDTHTFVTSAGTGRYRIAPTEGEGLCILLDNDGKAARVYPVGEIEIVWIEGEINGVPSGDTLDIIELRTARSMFWKAHETNRAREGVAEPIALLQGDVVRRADSQSEPNNSAIEYCSDTPCCMDKW